MITTLLILVAAPIITIERRILETGVSSSCSYLKPAHPIPRLPEPYETAHTTLVIVHHRGPMNLQSKTGHLSNSYHSTRMVRIHCMLGFPTCDRCKSAKHHAAQSLSQQLDSAGKAADNRLLVYLQIPPSRVTLSSTME